MKTKEEVIALFRAKYDYLKSVYPSVGPFEDSKINQNPDGGWQILFANKAAITLAPESDEAHETHGAICERWNFEGRVFDEKGLQGWLGYPTSDENQWSEKTGQKQFGGAKSGFERGEIMWEERNVRTGECFPSSNGTNCFVTPAGESFVPPDIEAYARGRLYKWYAKNVPIRNRMEYYIDFDPSSWSEDEVSVPEWAIKRPRACAVWFFEWKENLPSRDMVLALCRTDDVRRYELFMGKKSALGKQWNP